jgi:hypothetical protein
MFINNPFLPSSSSIHPNMSTFSFSTLQKVVEPAEVELRKQWEAISKRVVDAIASMPEEGTDKALAQAEWIAGWELLMVSCVGSATSVCLEGLSAKSRWLQGEAQLAHEKSAELKVVLPSPADTSEAEKRYEAWTTRIRLNSVSRKSSTKEPEEEVVADGDVDMDAAEPGASSSTAARRRKVVAKVRSRLLTA